jgi:CheY-like chemotaxis protein
VIFLDINMPVMDGFEFLKCYRHEFQRCAKKVAITFLTTSLRHEDLERAREFEEIVSGYIEKPLTKSVVLRFMEESL